MLQHLSPSLSRTVYTLLLYVLSPLVVLRLAWRGLKNPDYWRHWPQRFGWGAQQRSPRPIWIHAVSVGESQAAAPLIEALLQAYPQHPLLVTTTTPTGAARVRALFGNRVSHCYIPYDLPAAVRRFVGRVEPLLVVMMETEIWPNLYAQLSARKIPLVLANARLSQRSYQRYLKIKPLIHATLENCTHIAAQSPLDAGHFEALGVSPAKLSITGSLKFDISRSAAVVQQGAQLRAQLGNARRVWVAASTHEGEEVRMLAVFEQLQKLMAGQLLIIVPRHLERFDLVYQLCVARGYRVARRSMMPANGSDIDILIGDTMGELPMFFAASDAAFLGGSFVNIGGHNPLEASILAKPVVYGPQMFNFLQIHELLSRAGGARQVQTTDELVQVLQEWLNDEQVRAQVGAHGAQVVQDNQGALQRLLALLKPYVG